MKTKKTIAKILLVSLVVSFLSAPVKTQAATTLQKVKSNYLGLIGRWTFDGNDTTWTSATTGTTADTSGQGNAGTLINMNVSTSPSLGKIGQAFYFDGVNDRISLASDPISTNTVTVCAWFKTSSFSALESISSNGNFIFYVNTDGKVYVSSIGGGSPVVSADTVLLNTWTHVCAIRLSDGTATIFLNGSQSGSSGSSGTPVAGFGLGIGDRGYGTADPFRGSIDEFRIYNRAVSSSEASQLYRAGSAAVKKQSAYVRKSVGYSLSAGTPVSGFSVPAMVNTGGNFLAVFVKHEGTPTTITVSDTAGNIYTPLTKVNHVNNDLSGQWFYAKNIKASGSNVVSVSFAGNRPYGKLGVFEYSGIVTSEPFSKQVNGEGESVTAITTSSITTDGPYLALEGVGEYTTQTYTSALPWVERWDCEQEDSPCGGTAVAERAGNGKETFGAQMTQAVSSAYIASLVVFKLKSTVNNASQNTRITNGLIGLWSFNGPDYNAASTTAEVLDRSGQGNNGDAVNGPTRAIGKVGQALSFDGSDDYVNLGRLSYTESASQLTWSFWAYVDTIQDGDAFISKEDVYNSGSWHIGILTSCNVGNQLAVFIATSDGDGGTLGCADTVTAGVWTHYTVVYDGTKTGNANRLKIYINGTEDSLLDFIGTIPASTIVSANNVRIGDNPAGTARLKGKIDEVRIYNNALSGSEVKQLYNMSR